MDRFEFSSIKLLRLQATDNPDFSIKDGSLTITATREGSTIMIQAPITSEKALAAIKSDSAPVTISIEKEHKASKKLINVAKFPQRRKALSGKAKRTSGSSNQGVPAQQNFHEAI